VTVEPEVRRPRFTGGRLLGSTDAVTQKACLSLPWPSLTPALLVLSFPVGLSG
jgi:hypothetical protein